jgi:hypothetical protein
MIGLALTALAFSGPQSKGPALAKSLALRGGGVSTDVLYNSQLGLTLLTGLQGWLAPVSTLEMYGKKDVSAEESTFVRVLSGMNVVAAATLVAAKTSLDAAVTTCALAWALAISYNIPIFEKFDVPKPPLVSFIVLMGAAGAAAGQGLLPAKWAFYFVVPLFLIAISVGELLQQDKVLDMYNMPGKCTPLVKSLMLNFDMTKLAVGLFLLTTKITGKTGLGLAAMSATILANVVLTALKAEDTGVEKGGLIFWGVVQAAIGTLAYLNEK